jgi:membrane protein YdbS with pleckstrin-like domain
MKNNTNPPTGAFRPCPDLLGNLEYTARSGIYSYIKHTLLAGAAFWALGMFWVWLEPQALVLALPVKSLKPEWIHEGLIKTLWFLRALVIWTLISEIWRKLFIKIEVREQGLVLQSGFFRQQALYLPFASVRSLKLLQGLPNRWFDIGSVEIQGEQSHGLWACDDLHQFSGFKNALAKAWDKEGV